MPTRSAAAPGRDSKGGAVGTARGAATSVSTPPGFNEVAERVMVAEYP